MKLFVPEPSHDTGVNSGGALSPCTRGLVALAWTAVGFDSESPGRDRAGRVLVKLTKRSFSKTAQQTSEDTYIEEAKFFDGRCRSSP